MRSSYSALGVLEDQAPICFNRHALGRQQERIGKRFGP